ncbi:MAG: segregation/condensation protein A [Leptolyngbyaceae cyanobacterium RU_5_1]|nr:segregation/condensation protein A [Leptolyngbyaceae cyanobacterium RU_5_1]
MTLSLAEDAIALLIDMAEQGEIDPWDVKVIEVIDRFLNELPPLVDGREPYEKSLSSSGQAFLYASMLVLLKADNLAQPDSAADDLEAVAEAELSPDEISPATLPPYLLERQLRRRAVAQPAKRRRVTLTDLIEQLRTIAKALEDPTPRKRPHRPPPQSRSQTVRAIAQLAHQENLSEMSTALEQFFTDHWSTIHLTQGWLDFELLLELWSQMSNHGFSHPSQPSHSEQSPSRHDRVGIFWALLLLSAQSKVELAQDEFYRDLRVRPFCQSSESNGTDRIS